jgi:nicotinate-nucleotide pyrophosphorylase (carboxylating)
MAAELDPAFYKNVVAQALAEDVGAGDITTSATVPPDASGRGVFLAKSECVLAGLAVAFEAFRQIDARVEVRALKKDGDACAPGDQLAEVAGAARTLLIGERTALNFLQRLSGIATLSRRFVRAAGGGITVLDTRKTTPTLRALEKYAVAVGGAKNHRMGLFDAVLIKDNHARLAGGVARAVGLARRGHAGTVEVEAQSLADVDEALAAGADIILADNMTTPEIREVVRRAHGLAKVEISGGVTLERLPELAATGADYVSVGALTHSAPAADISFEIETSRPHR